MTTPAVVETHPCRNREQLAESSDATCYPGIRTLPIRVAPIEGESLESWLAAIAVRMNVTWAQLIDTVLPKDAQALRRRSRGWVPGPDEVAAIAAATGVQRCVIRGLTLTGTSASWLKIDAVNQTASTPWGRALRQRFCPRCLSRTGGRWSLDWRLPWITICSEHRCFLVNNCPECGRGFQTAPGWADSPRGPQPTRCCCGNDLRDAATDVLAANHAAIAVHETLRELLTQDTVNTGIYCAKPVSGAQVLTDVHRLAVGLFRTATPETLVRGFGHRQSTAEIRFWSDRVWRHVPRRGLRPVQFAAGAPAPVVCAGATAALRIMLCDPTYAAAALTRIASSPRPRIPPKLAFRGHYPSSALCAVDILSCANGWDPIEKLRFCVYARLPRHPTLPRPADHDLTLHATPTLMWTDWALALAPCISGRLAWTTQRQLLSWLLLEVGSRRSETSIQAGLRVKIERKRVHETAVAMSRHHSWDQLATVLTQLHDHLVHHPPPIDYQRRRELDYSRLLTSTQWLAICTRGAVRTRSDWLCDTAREWLSERLSAAPASVRSATEGRQALAIFLMVLTPELKRELDSHATDFLQRQGITDEPVVWSPPPAIREDCALPRSAHEALTITDLHAVLDRPHAGIYEASRQLRVPIHSIRYLLEEHPLPTRRKRHPTNAQRFRDACDDLELRRLYLDEFLTLNEISQRFGIPAGPHMAERARACGIPLRHEPRKPIDAQWLWEQHVIRRRTLSEIAADSGDTISRIRYWATQHRIPITKYRRRQLNLDVTQHARELHVEKLLNPVRSDKQGWQRLQRFAAMSSYPTFVEAAQAIGCRADTLSTQIAALEDDFGQRLVERAVRQKKPMRLTDFGARVVKAVQAIERRLAVI